jgi:hypothetical protein
LACFGVMCARCAQKNPRVRAAGCFAHKRAQSRAVS